MEKLLKHFWRLRSLQYSLHMLHPGNNKPYKWLTPMKKYIYGHNAISDITIHLPSMYTIITISHKEVSTLETRDKVSQSHMSWHHLSTPGTPCVPYAAVPCTTALTPPTAATFRNYCNYCSHEIYCLTVNPRTSAPHTWCSLSIQYEIIKTVIYILVDSMMGFKIFEH